jgi:hypothetical protein
MSIEVVHESGILVVPDDRKRGIGYDLTRGAVVHANRASLKRDRLLLVRGLTG